MRSKRTEIPRKNGMENQMSTIQLKKRNSAIMQYPKGNMISNGHILSRERKSKSMCRKNISNEKNKVDPENWTMS